MPSVRGLKPSRLYRERAVLLRYPPVAYDSEFEEVVTPVPTRSDILVTRTAVRWGEFDETEPAGRSIQRCLSHRDAQGTVRHALRHPGWRRTATRRPDRARRQDVERG